jgi:hypothetical protein
MLQTSTSLPLAEFGAIAGVAGILLISVLGFASWFVRKMVDYMINVASKQTEALIATANSLQQLTKRMDASEDRMEHRHQEMIRAIRRIQNIEDGGPDDDYRIHGSSRRG